MNYIGLITQMVGAGGQVAEGRRNKIILENAGKAAEEQSLRDSEAIAREYRQLAGRQAAAMAENGGAYEGSNVKLLHQSEMLAFLDQLNIRYKGRMRRIELETEGASANRRGFFSGVSSMGSMGSGMTGGFGGGG
jgi:hypothetical protein